jgi:hypothetical protein
MNQGDTIASYQLEAPLSELRVGAWRARHMVSGQAFRLDLWQTDCDAQEYVREMKAVASLRHQHISSILEFGLHSDGLGWTVSQLLTGTSVAKTLEERGQPAYRTALELCFVISRAVETAHGHGVHHGALNLLQCTWVDERILITGWGRVSPAKDVNRMRIADIVFLGDLVLRVTHNPPAPLKALIESPPKTSGAYRRALAAALGAVSMSDRAPLVPSPEASSSDNFVFHGETTIETGSSLALALSTSYSSGSYADASRSSANVDPVGPTDEHTIETMAAMADWGIEKDDDQGWLDTDREEVRTSNQYVANDAGDDSWGVGLPAPPPAISGPSKNELPSGMRIHTVGKRDHIEDSRLRRNRPSAGLMMTIAALLGMGALLWYGMGSRKNLKSERIHDRTLAGHTQSAPDTPLGLRPSPVTTQSDTLNDANAPMNGPNAGSLIESAFELRANVPVKVVRVSDGKVICKESAICSVSVFKEDAETIDTHYRLSNPKFEPKVIKGYEIHDIRMRGHMRVVMPEKEDKSTSSLRKKNRKKNRKKRRGNKPVETQ